MLRIEIAIFFGGHRFKSLTAALVAENQCGAIVGFAELSIRDDLPGLEGKRTGYLEGLYVLPEIRQSVSSLSLPVPAESRPPCHCDSSR